MLRVNQLTGFGGGGGPAFLLSTGSASNTNSPTFTVDLGPPGVKQVMVVFTCEDTLGSDPWDWGTGDIGGESFTYVVGSGRENAGTGSTYTGGVTIRALSTSLSGSQTVTMPITLFSGTMNTTRMMAVVVRGFSATPISYDGGTNQGASNGDDFTISTVGARLVIGGSVADGDTGNLQGPGTEVTAFSGTGGSAGYDLAPAGTGGNVYSFTNVKKYVIAGASFG